MRVHAIVAAALLVGGCSSTDTMTKKIDYK
jgi:outer membrane murein-binding lipoprotein Lpp